MRRSPIGKYYVLVGTTAACKVYNNDLVSIINFVKRRLRQRIVPVLPTVPGQEGVLPLAEDTFEGSYVAVSKPGKGTVHIVNGRGGSPLYGTGTKTVRSVRRRKMKRDA
jgi:hypothetical protein